MTYKTLNKLWSFHRLKITNCDFENWIYSKPGLESELGYDIYLELVSFNFKNKNDDERLRNLVENILNEYDYTYKCSCVKLDSIDIIGMGSDEHFFLDTFKQVKKRGEKYWWLYMSQCEICKTYWLIAQEERQNDDLHLLKLNQEQAKNISEQNIWPNDFDEYENLLILSKKAGHSVRFDDPINSSMVFTVIDLVKNRPNINSREISDLLNLDLETANEIFKFAMIKAKIQTD